MASDESVWERFLRSKWTPSQQGASQLQSGILDGRSINLSAGSTALSADADTAGMMRELALKSIAELLSEKASRELARRNRYVDYVRTVFNCAVADSSGRKKKAEITVRCIEAIHTCLVVDKPARDLLGVLLAELDDMETDRVPLVVDAILDPLFEASRRQGASIFQALNSEDGMSETGASGFLIALELLPKLLGLTAGVTALGQGPPVPEFVRGLSGTQYKERVVLRIFRARWPGPLSIGICQALRDLNLGERQLKVAVSRVLRHLRSRAELHDLPPLTYQLLLLAGRGCKEAALEGVIRVFDRLDVAAEATGREDAAAASGHIPMRRGARLGSSSTEELRFVEGTILLHFNFAMKQDHGLASCLLKGFQRRAAAPEIARAFTPFRVALVLSMARIQRFGQPVLDLVQDIVTDCFTYDHLREESAWLETEENHARGTRRDGVFQCTQEADGDLSDGEGGDNGYGASHNSSSAIVEKVLLAVVRSSRGWDHLVGSLLKLGLQLLDRGGAGAGTGGSATGPPRGMLEKLQGSQNQRALLRASHLGRVVLMETFKTHEIVRRQVLASVLEQVTARSQGVMSYVKLLGLLAERNPNLLLDDAEAVRDVFGYISVLPPPVAERFLRAVAPLLRLRPRLHDSVVLPLRKALFSREERARLVAVGGLVLLLGIQSRETGREEAVPLSHGGTQLSQASQSGEGLLVSSFPGGGGGGGALSLAEGFGLLRRCLTQQLIVRVKLYDGLLAAFCRGSIELQVDMISILAGHLRRYVNVSATQALTSGGGAGGNGAGAGAGGDQPLLLKRCLDPHTWNIVEPLPLLIGCLYRMLSAGREALAAHDEGLRGAPGEEDVHAGGMNYGANESEDVGAESVAIVEALRDSLDELGSDLSRLSQAVSSAELESFGLDKIADFSPDGGPRPRQNLAAAALLCGSYEALMQGSLLIAERPLSVPGSGSRNVGIRAPPPSSALQDLLALFDRRQNLIQLVRPSLPSSAQHRGKKAAGGSAHNSGASFNGSGAGNHGDSEGAANAGANGVGVGLPGFSAAGCFALTLHPGGMPCLGMAFVEDLLTVLNVEAGGSREEADESDAEGGTEKEAVVINERAGEPPIQAVKDDLGLQRLVLETCRGHLRTLRTSTASAGSGISVEVGGGASTRGAAGSSISELNRIQSPPQDEADAARAGKAAVKRCTALAPLLLREVFRQLTLGNNSSAAKAAAAAAKANSAKSGKGKSKSKSSGLGGDASDTDAIRKKGGRSSLTADSLSELALSCLEECVCIAAYCSPQVRTGASRTAKLLTAAYKSLPDSNVPPADPDGGPAGKSVLGRHASALVQTLSSLIADEQAKEAEIMSRILSQLTRLLKLEPPVLQAFASSLRTVCKEQRTNSPVLAKAVVSLYLKAHMSMQTKGDHVDALNDLATQVRPCLGLLEEDEDEDDVPPEAVSFRIINNFTIAPVSEVALIVMERCIEDLEYALRLLDKAAIARQARDASQRLRGLSRLAGGRRAPDSQSSGTVSEDGCSSEVSADSDRNSESDSDMGGVRSDGGFGERDPLDRRETLMCDRLQKVMQAMAVLIGCRLEYRCIEKLVSCASRVFRTVTKVLKVRLAMKRAYVGAGLKRVLESKKRFTKKLQALLPWVEGEKGTKVTKNNISRQSRIVPELIFQVEQCDVHLLKLGKLCKGSLDLPKWVTHRVDRDFRIDRKVISSCQEEEREALARKNKRKVKAEKAGNSKKKTKKQPLGSEMPPPEKDADEASDDDEDGETESGARTVGGCPGNDKDEDRDDEGDDGDEEGDDDEHGTEEDE